MKQLQVALQVSNCLRQDLSRSFRSGDLILLLEFRSPSSRSSLADLSFANLILRLETWLQWPQEPPLTLLSIGRYDGHLGIVERARLLPDDSCRIAVHWDAVEKLCGLSKEEFKAMREQSVLLLLRQLRQAGFELEQMLQSPDYASPISFSIPTKSTKIHE